MPYHSHDTIPGGYRCGHRGARHSLGHCSLGRQPFVNIKLIIIKFKEQYSDDDMFGTTIVTSIPHSCDDSKRGDSGENITQRSISFQMNVSNINSSW